MKKVLIAIYGIIFAAFVCYIGYNTFVISGAKIEEYMIFGDVDDHGQTTLMVVTPKNELLCYKMYEDIVECGYYHIVPFKTSNYFGLVYKFDNGIFKWRILPKANNVYNLGMKLLYKEGGSFPDVGKIFKAQMIVYDDKVEMNRVTYRRKPIETSDISSIEEDLKAYRSYNQ